ncbi:MAG: type II toxin-antitoxin system RelE/ParE family toxin [Syntrophobacteraceae bacterium]
MKIYETARFQKQRKKLRGDSEKTALKEATRSVGEDPLSGEKLKGEFKGLRSLRYYVEGQERRMIYNFKENAIYLLSFGPREGIYR